MTAENFTENELKVLKAAYESMKGNGFDFGFIDEVRPDGMTPKSAGDTLRGLRKKLRSCAAFGTGCRRITAASQA